MKKSKKQACIFKNAGLFFVILRFRLVKERAFRGGGGFVLRQGEIAG